MGKPYEMGRIGKPGDISRKITGDVSFPVNGGLNLWR
jgi:hypothetical protein